MAKSPKQDDKRDDIEIDEAARRKGDAASLRALKTPPQPHTKKVAKEGKASLTKRKGR